VEDSIRKSRDRKPRSGVLLVEAVLPNDRLISSYRAIFANRGAYIAGPATVSVQFPFPLVKCWYRSSQLTKFYVAPALGELLPGWRNQLSHQFSQLESHASRSGNNAEEFFAIRNWQAGDNLRHIHWRSTAKIGQPMVRQFDSYAARTLTIAADLHADGDRVSSSMHFESASQSCEQILSLLATLLKQWRQQRAWKLVIAVADEQATTHIADRNSQFESLLHRRLATAKACRHTAIGDLIDGWIDASSGSSGLLILSSRGIPAEWKDVAPNKRIDWVHCTADTIQHFFQQSAPSRFAKAAG